MKTRGDFVAFLDHDDYWDLGKLSRQLPVFTDPDVALVHAGYAGPTRPET